MARPMTSAAATALAAGDLRPALLFEGVFSDGTLRLTSWHRDLSWDSQTWTAAGNLVGFTPAEESASVEAPAWTVTLSGVPSSLVSTALGSVRQGKTGRVWLALLTAAEAITVDPFLLAAGRLNIPALSDDGETSTISVTYEGHLRDLNAANEVRYTHEQQQQLFPGDLGFEFVTSIVDREIRWGSGF